MRTVVHKTVHTKILCYIKYMKIVNCPKTIKIDLKYPYGIYYWNLKTFFEKNNILQCGAQNGAVKF